MPYLLVMDTETGGIDVGVSVLTVYFGLFNNENGKCTLIDQRTWTIAPNDGIYKVTSSALEVNKIDLVKHDKLASKESVIQVEMYDVLAEWKSIAKDRLIPVGHNIGFDIKHITHSLIHPEIWEQRVSHRQIDTSVIARFLILSGKLPVGLSGSLSSLVQHFNIELEGNAHEAKRDALATIAVLSKMLELVNN